MQQLTQTHTSLAPVPAPLSPPNNPHPQSATGIICNITSKQVGLGEVHHIGEIISPMAGPGCSIKYGAVNDPTYADDELQVTLM
jgi:cell division GTPase FtsZ